MRRIKFRGRAMGGDYVYGLPTLKKLRTGEVVLGLMTAPTGRFSDVVPIVPRTLEQFIGGQWEAGEYTEETFNEAD